MEEKMIKLLETSYWAKEEIISNFISSKIDFNCNWFTSNLKEQLSILLVRKKTLDYQKKKNQGIDNLIEVFQTKEQIDIIVFYAFNKISGKGFCLYVNQPYSMLYGFILLE